MWQSISALKTPGKNFHKVFRLVGGNVKMIFCIDDFDLKDKGVFLRTDFNVPVEKGGDVKDHIRLHQALRTLKYALKHQARVVIGSHRGRPGGRPDEDKKLFSLEPFGYYLSQKLGCEAVFWEDIHLPVPGALLSSLNEKKILLLENLRFHPGEEAQDRNFASTLSRGLSVYINEAFSVSHRPHTSLWLLPLQFSQRGQGFSMREEQQVLDRLLDSQSSRPLALVIGGVKVADKIQTLNTLSRHLDVLLVGGKMAYTFLKARGEDIPLPCVEKSSVAPARDIMERLQVKGKQVLLPVDHCLASEKDPSFRKVCPVTHIPPHFQPRDIGPQTMKMFHTALQPMKAVFWNGPLGHFENPLFAEGTEEMGKTLSSLKEAFRVVGGGDCTAAVHKMGLQNHFSHILTGGGASLKYLQNQSLPGMESLKMAAG